jgi:hypothetical protein
MLQSAEPTLSLKQNPTVEHFLTVFQAALAAIREPRLFATERGYQGALIGELQNRLNEVALPGDPIIEQEYQKTLPHHGITIRPDLIVHVPFERGGTRSRNEGNFVAIEMKVNATAAEADEDFASLALMKERLGYQLTIFLNIGGARSYAERCPQSIAAQTVCFAAQLRQDTPVVSLERCA